MKLDTMLGRLGLPAHSGTVYEALETLGPASPTTLARTTHLFRPSIYRALMALVHERFVYTRTVGKRTVYVAHERTRIAHAFAGLTKQVERAAAPKRSARESVGMITYYEGAKGVAAIFDDVITHSRRGDTFYRYTSERDVEQVNSYLSPAYRTTRDAKRLERLVISNPDSGSRKRKRLERFIKFLGTGTESFRENAIQLIYGSRVAFVDLNTMRGLIIDNPTLAQFQKTIFKALYKRL